MECILYSLQCLNKTLDWVFEREQFLACKEHNIQFTCCFAHSIMTPRVYSDSVTIETTAIIIEVFSLSFLRLDYQYHK